MNDRLRIASEQLAALNSDHEYLLSREKRYEWALAEADALLAAAGEQESKPGHWHAVAMRQVDEIDAFRARAEAAEAKVAELEAKLAAAARLAQDSAEAAGEMVDGGGRLTKEQAVIVSAYTGYLVCDFTDMHEAIERKIGRSVWTHEMADKETLSEIRDAFKSDFMALAPQEAAHD